MAKEDHITQQQSLTVAPDDNRWLERNESQQLQRRLKALYILGEEVHRIEDYKSLSSLALDFFQDLLSSFSVYGSVSNNNPSSRNLCMCAQSFIKI